MAKVTLQFWDRGPIGGWHAAVVIEGKRHPVPPKNVGDGHGAAIAVAFDGKADAERHALAHARRTLRQSAQRPGSATERSEGRRSPSLRHPSTHETIIWVRLTLWDGSVIDGELVDGTFPDYERVIPRGDPKHGTATLAREPFTQAVAAVTAFARASGAKWPVSPALRFAFTAENLTVSAAMEGDGSGCRGSASVALDIAASTITEPRDIGFYGPQLLDILSSLQGPIRLLRCRWPEQLAGDHADGNALHVLMPVRL